jgi:hypothetical protein
MRHPKTIPTGPKFYCQSCAKGELLLLLNEAVFGIFLGPLHACDGFTGSDGGCYVVGPGHIEFGVGGICTGMPRGWPVLRGAAHS